MAAVFLVSACQPPVPYEPVGGVGFESYSDYQARQAAAAAAARVPVVSGRAPVNQLPASSAPATPIVSAPISAPLPQTPAIQGSAALAPAALAPATPTPAGPLPNTGISDEQDFSAVAARESIASDKQRIDQNKAQFQQIAPKALPNRTGSGVGPDIIAYAISAPNRLGEPTYKRTRALIASHERACARFDTPEDAQAAFLKVGGPRRDPKNLDPDGDGFACHWDPTPFQKVRG